MRKNHTRMNMIGEDVLLRYHYDNNHDDTDNNTHNNDIDNNDTDNADHNDTDNNHKIKNSRTQVKSSEVKWNVPIHAVFNNYIYQIIRIITTASELYYTIISHL